MGMYMYKMGVPTAKNWVSDDMSYPIKDEYVNLAFLRECNVGEDDYFTIDENADNLDVSRRRIETDTEFQVRVDKAVKYNKKYDEYHSKK